MYIGIDIGGTKTLVILFSDAGEIVSRTKFPTPSAYPEFLRVLSKAVAKVPAGSLASAGVALPGRIDRKHGVGIACGNLPWEQVPIDTDLGNILHCSVAVENDANLAGLSEAMMLKDTYSRVLYVTLSTGIGTGFIVDQHIDASTADSEGGQVMVEQNGTLQTWENLASGRAIVRDFGHRAEDITDSSTWHAIAHRIALGLIDLIATLQPDAIVIGGGVGTYFERFSSPLVQELQHYETPIVPIPPIIKAARPEEAVAYGCLELARSINAVSP
jgi:predicted NBD/HSP70 family sugar kinase